jgi:hypothetical protein
MRKRSTVDTIHRLLNWADARSEKYVVGVFLDITGAFDCLWWPQLIVDLENLGCSSDLVQLTKSYLNDRTAQLRIGGQTLTKKLTKGCPQGSSFGPDLWKYAINPLLSQLLPGHNEIIAYADDLALLVAANSRRDLEERIAELLQRALDWAKQRKLTFSVPKTQAMLLKGALIRSPTAKIAGENIKFTTSVRYLGVTVDKQRNFELHRVEKVNESKEVFSRTLRVTRGD